MSAQTAEWSVDRIGSSGSDRTVTFQEIFGGNGDHRNSDHAISDGFNSNGLYGERRFKVASYWEIVFTVNDGNIGTFRKSKLLESVNRLAILLLVN